MAKTVLTDNTYCPDLVDSEIYGHHKSFVNRAGTTRTWTFKTEEGAAKFKAAIQENPFQFFRNSLSSRSK